MMENHLNSNSLIFTISSLLPCPGESNTQNLISNNDNLLRNPCILSNWEMIILNLAFLNFQTLYPSYPLKYENIGSWDNLI